MLETMPDAILAADILKDFKYLATCATMAAMEADDPNLRSAFVEHARDELIMAEELYRLMRRRGWYPEPPRAEREQVEWAAQRHRQAAQGFVQAGQAPATGGFRAAGGFPAAAPQNPWTGLGDANAGPNPGPPGVGGPAGGTVGAWGGTGYDPTPHAGGPGYWNPGTSR